MIAVKLLLLGDKPWSIGELAESVGVSKTETHAALKRCIDSRILDYNQKVLTLGLQELLIHAVKYMFPAEVGTMVRGMPTAISAPPMKGMISSSDNEIFVWPYGLGKKRGISISPLYKSVPVAAENDGKLYEILVLVDVIRIGRLREKKIAAEELLKRIGK